MKKRDSQISALNKKLNDVKTVQAEIKKEILKINQKLERSNSYDSLNQKELKKSKYIFYYKLWFALAFAIALFVVYIFLLKFLLPITGASDDIIIGFVCIITIPLLLTLLAVYYIRKDISEYEGYYRLLSDFIAVLVPIVIMYKTYYAPQIHPVFPDDNIILIFLSNEGLLGIPFVILLIRFIIAIYSLKEKENNITN